MQPHKVLEVLVLYVLFSQSLLYHLVVLVVDDKVYMVGGFDLLRRVKTSPVFVRFFQLLILLK